MKKLEEYRRQYILGREIWYLFKGDYSGIKGWREYIIMKKNKTDEDTKGALLKATRWALRELSKDLRCWHRI